LTTLYTELEPQEARMLENCHTATAYHEAGHAALAHITGVYTIDGNIVIIGARHATVPVLRDAKLCHARGLIIGHTTSDVLDYESAIIFAAGIEAESRYLRESNIEVDQPQLEAAAGGDLDVVMSLLGAGHWTEVRARADRYLRAPGIWDVVKKLASAIMFNNGILSNASATNVLETGCIEFDVAPYVLLKGD
jgi:hypothetical protein